MEYWFSARHLQRPKKRKNNTVPPYVERQPLPRGQLHHSPPEQDFQTEKNRLLYVANYIRNRNAPRKHRKITGVGVCDGAFRINTAKHLCKAVAVVSYISCPFTMYFLTNAVIHFSISSFSTLTANSPSNPQHQFPFPESTLNISRCHTATSQSLYG